VFAGGGGIKSTASDMLIYLDANLHPEKYAARATLGSPAATLPAAIALEHEARADMGDGKIALAWWIDPKTHSLSHQGGTNGYESFARFNPVQDWAVITLYNRWVMGDPRLVDFLELVIQNVSALLGSGDPSPPPDFTCEADKTGLARLGMR
jgi:serine-type D-Ala-D-Ala carboxypeptidase/endopeptidase